jgi:hypothetical protein
MENLVESDMAVGRAAHQAVALIGMIRVSIAVLDMQ